MEIISLDDAIHVENVESTEKLLLLDVFAHFGVVRVARVTSWSGVQWEHVAWTP